MDLPAIAARIDAQAARTPSAPAVRAGAVCLDYLELCARASRVARRLAALGIGPETIVGLAVPRSVDTVVALLGVLRSGAAFLPLDTALPRSRLAFMLDDAAPRAVIASAAVAQLLPAGNVLAIEELTAGEAAGLDGVSGRDSGAVDPRTLGYVIYTSGTTGAPKAVMVEHGALARVLAALSAHLPFRPGDRHLAIANLTFDISLFELLGPLCGGAEVIVAETATIGDGAALAALIERSGATSVQATPSHWQVLVELLRPGPTDLRIAVGGEPLSATLAARLLTLSPRAWNLYGPTEATIWASVAPLTEDALDAEDSPVAGIGSALDSHRLYVLDANLMLSPAGVAGELYISGVALARGYLNRTALTAERFVADPYGSPGTRMYRTGDLARRSPEGTLEYLGRVDRQVKIRGLRIELAEIEHALRAAAGVRDAAVVVEPHEVAPRLIAYVQPAAAPGPTPEQLKEHLALSLPHYMVPSEIVAVESWPLTPNGKLDYAALPRPAAGRTAASAVWPRTPMQAQLCAIFASLLGRPDVGVDDDFFELGGHSLLVMHALVRIHEQLQVSVAVQDFFERPTVTALTAHIEAGVAAGRTAGRAADAIVASTERSPAKRRAPLSFSQEQHMIRRLLTREQWRRAAYSMPVTLRLVGAVDRNALERALAEIVERHEILRTRFRPARSTRLFARVTPALAKLGRYGRVRKTGKSVVIGAMVKGGLFYQEPVRHVAVPVRFADLRHLLPAEQVRAMYRLPEIQEPFDLDTPPLLRAALLRTGAQEHVLVVIVSHMAFDEWSEQVLRTELLALYDAFLDGRPSPLPPLPIQYRDFAVWERQRLTSDFVADAIQTWKTLLPEGAAPLHLRDLPFHTRAGAEEFKAAEIGTWLGAAAAADVARACRAERVTTFVMLLAALNITLSRASDRRRIGVFAGFANRARPETERVIGWFTRWHLISTPVEASDSFRDVLRSTRDVVLSAIAVQEIPVTLLVLHGILDVSTPDFGARPHVAFQLRTEGIGGAAAPDTSATRTFSMGEGPAYRGLPGDSALKVTAVQRTNDIEIRVTYSTDWFTAEGAGELLDAYVAVLRDLTTDGYGTTRIGARQNAAVFAPGSSSETWTS